MVQFEFSYRSEWKWKEHFRYSIKGTIATKGFKVQYLNAERLVGLESKDYSYFSNSNFMDGFLHNQIPQIKSKGKEYGVSGSAFIRLKERLDLRIKVEATLSNMFNRKLFLREEGGLKIILQKHDGIEYQLKTDESHGLKEIISLLTFLYDDENNCIILDEPELHLHPQFQSFLLHEIKKIAGSPNDGKKLFFILTHSTHFVDISGIEHFSNCIIFHEDNIPTHVDLKKLDNDDIYRINRFIDRFNNENKQFFFAKHPVFVEGFTDKQIFALIYEKRDIPIGAFGSSIIETGGKEELDMFFRLCI